MGNKKPFGKQQRKEAQSAINNLFDQQRYKKFICVIDYNDDSYIIWFIFYPSRYQYSALCVISEEHISTINTLQGFKEYVFKTFFELTKKPGKIFAKEIDEGYEFTGPIMSFRIWFWSRVYLLKYKFSQKGKKK